MRRVRRAGIHPQNWPTLLKQASFRFDATFRRWCQWLLGLADRGNEVRSRHSTTKSDGRRSSIAILQLVSDKKLGVDLFIQAFAMPIFLGARLV